MNAAGTSIQHLRELLTLAEELAKGGITLYAHEYHPLSFGSFSVEFGRPHYRVLCQWDGKESILAVSFAELTNQGQRGEWIHDAYISVPGDDVYAEIAKNVSTMAES
jgi:hypothetical protein